MVEEIDKSDAQVLMRKLELEAYSGVVTALRVHGDLVDRGKAILDELRDIFSVSEERHKAEMRRVANDDHLSQIAQKAMGSVTCENWLAEGRRLLPPLPRIDPQTAFARLANAASKKQVKIEMAKFFEAKDVLERALKKQEESRASMLESEDRLETKRRLAELAPLPDTPVSEDLKSKSNQIAHRKRVRVCSPQPSPSAAEELLAHSDLASKNKKSQNCTVPKKQRLRMSPSSGSSSVQENLPADEAGVSLPPTSLSLASPVKCSVDPIGPISPLATPGQMARNIDLFANQTDHNVVSNVSDDLLSSAEKNKVSPKSPKLSKEKKPKQSKKKGVQLSSKMDAMGENSVSFSASPPVTLAGVGSRPAQVNLIQQQSGQHHSQPPGATTVVISNTSHGQVVVSSPPAQNNLVHASPGKAAQSSYHNYAPPLAPLSINPMRLVGRAGAGVAISTAAASPPSIAANTLRPQDPSGNIPLIRLTPQQPQHQRAPLILATGGSRPTAILTPGAPGVPGVLTIRSHRPTLTPVAPTAANMPVRPAIVIHQAPTAAGGNALVMRRIGPAASTTAVAPTNATATSQPPVSTTAISTLPSNRPLIISSSAAPGANGSVVVISKQQALQLQQQPPVRPTILQPTTPPTQPSSSVVSTASNANPRNNMRDFSYASHFQAATKQMNELYSAESEICSPPAVGAESVVETSHDHLTNGNTFENNSIRDASNNSTGLVLLQQAAAAIADSTTANAVEFGNFIVDKDLCDQELASYEDVEEAFNHNGNSGNNPSLSNAASHDAELFNEDLMMAIRNSTSANGQHRQSQPS